MSANPSNRIAGTIYLFIDGVSVPIVGDLEYSSALVKRETMAGSDRVHGFKESPAVPFIAMTVRDMSGVSVAQINAMTNVTVNAELANGKLIVGRNMWSVEQPASKTNEATIEIRFEGPQGSVSEN